VLAGASHDASGLWAAGAAARSRPPRPGLRVRVEHPPGPAPDAAAPDAAAPDDAGPGGAVDLTVRLVVVDPEHPESGGGRVATVLAVSPGTSTRADLARLAVAVDEHGGSIAGLLVADPDPEDRTTGRRTLDERARQPALPVRMTGALPARGPTAALGRGGRGQ